VVSLLWLQASSAQAQPRVWVEVRLLASEQEKVWLPSAAIEKINRQVVKRLSTGSAASGPNGHRIAYHNRYNDGLQSTLNSKEGFAQVNLSGDNEKYTCSCDAGRTNCRHLKGLASPAHGNRRAMLQVSIWEFRLRRIDGRSWFFGAKKNRSETASFIQGSALSAPAILRVNQEPN
jgi:hypothetical protein